MARHCACPRALRPRDDRAILSGLARVRSLLPRYLFLRCHPTGHRTSSKSERSASSPTLHRPVVALSLSHKSSPFLCRVIPIFYSPLRVLAFPPNLSCFVSRLSSIVLQPYKRGLRYFFALLLLSYVVCLPRTSLFNAPSHLGVCKSKNERRARSGEGRSGRRCALGSQKGKGTCRRGGGDDAENNSRTQWILFKQTCEVDQRL